MEFVSEGSANKALARQGEFDALVQSIVDEGNRSKGTILVYE